MKYFLEIFEGQPSKKGNSDYYIGSRRRARVRLSSTPSPFVRFDTIFFICITCLILAVMVKNLLVICSQKENYFELFANRTINGEDIVVDQAPWVDVEIVSYPGDLSLPLLLRPIYSSSYSNTFIVPSSLLSIPVVGSPLIFFISLYLLLLSWIHPSLQKYAYSITLFILFVLIICLFLLSPHHDQLIALLFPLFLFIPFLFLKLKHYNIDSLLVHIKPNRNPFPYSTQGQFRTFAPHFVLLRSYALGIAFSCPLLPSPPLFLFFSPLLLFFSTNL